VTLQDCFFSDSVVQSGTFININVVVTFSMSNCRFNYVYVENTLIKLTPTGLFSFLPIGSDGNSVDFYLNHISITNVSFENVIAAPRTNFNSGAVQGNQGFGGVFVSVAISGWQGMNVLLDSLRFQACLASSAFITVTRSLQFANPSTELYGNSTLYTTGLTRIPLKIPFNWARVRNTTFQSAYSSKNLVTFSKFGNVEMSLVSFIDSGDGLNVISVNYLLTGLVTRPEVYMQQGSIGTTVQSCSAPVTYQQVTNATVLNCHFRNTTCLYIPPAAIGGKINTSTAGLGGIQVTAHLGPFSLSNVTMQDFSAPSVTGGTALTIASAGPIRLSQLVLTDVINPSSTGTGLVVISVTTAVPLEMAQCRVQGTNYFGPIVKITAGFTLLMSDSVFVNCIATSIVSFWPLTNLTWTQVDVQRSNFTLNSGGDGAIFYLTSPALTPVPLTLCISHCLVANNTSNGAGLALYMDTKSVLTHSSITGSTFYGNAAQDGLIGLFFLSGALNIANCSISDNVAVGTALIVVSPVPQIYPVLSISQSYLVRNRANVIVKVANPNGVVTVSTANNTCTSNSATVFSLDRANLTDFRSLFDSNQGSALRCLANSQLTLTDTVFSQGNSSLGGAAYLGGSSNFTCVNCVFAGNVASLHGGAVYIEQESVLTARNSVFIRNKSGHRGAAVYLFGSSVNSTLRNCSFWENDSGDSGALVVISGSLRLIRCDFQANTGRKTVGMSVYFSSVSLSSSTLRNHRNLTSPFIYSALESVLTVNSTSIEGLSTSSEGGFLYALSSSFSLFACSFKDIQAETGAVALTNAGSTFSISNTTMVDVRSGNQFGGVLAFAGGAGNFTNVAIEQFTGGGIVAADLTTLLLSHVAISANPSLTDKSSYGGLYCSGCTKVLIQNCAFSNLSAVKGAALYLSGNAFHSGSRLVDISDSVFRGLASYEGGLYISDMNAVVQRSTFQSCHAYFPIGNGGALSLYCSLTTGCSFLFRSCLFANNSAEAEGGSIHWMDAMPIVEDTVFEGGKAYYGPDFSSFPVQLHLTAIQGNASLGHNDTADYEGTLFEVASGQVVAQTIVASVVDHYGQVVSTLNGATATLVPADDGSELFGTTSVTSVNGSFTLAGFGLTATPNTAVYFRVFTSAIDFTRKNVSKDNVTYSNSATMQAVLRPCQIGESYFQNQCAICPAGKYSLSPETSCQDCSANAICYGNFTMVPRAGYWRSSVLSSTFWSCPYDLSCTGSPEPPAQLVLTGNCATGYFGNLCNGCLPGFSRLNQVECARCPSFTVNLIRTIGVGIAFLIALILIVATAIRSAYQSSSYFSIYIKVLLNYLQLVMLTSSLNLSWPSYMLQLVKTQQTVGNVTDQVFSIDCFFDNSSPDDQANAVRSKILLLSFLPLLMCLLAALCTDYQAVE